jgi:hypothetical protein
MLTDQQQKEDEACPRRGGMGRHQVQMGRLDVEGNSVYIVIRLSLIGLRHPGDCGRDGG